MITLIDEHRAIHRVEPICRVLPIAPSTYHAHIARRADPSKGGSQVRRDGELHPHIRRGWAKNFGVHGVRKVWPQLGREAGRVQVIEIRVPSETVQAWEEMQPPSDPLRPEQHDPEEPRLQE